MATLQYPIFVGDYSLRRRRISFRSSSRVSLDLNCLADLPPEDLYLIFEKLGHPKWLGRCAQVCSRWNDLLNEASLWKSLVRSVGVDVNKLCGQRIRLPTVFWKAICHDVYQALKVRFFPSLEALIINQGRTAVLTDQTYYTTVVLNRPMKPFSGIYRWIMRVPVTINIGIVDDPYDKAPIQTSMHGWAFYALTKSSFHNGNYKLLRKVGSVTGLRRNEIMVELDTNRGELAFTLGNTYYGVAFNNLYAGGCYRVFWPAVTLNHTDESATVTAISVGEDLVRFEPGPLPGNTIQRLPKN